MAATQVLDTDAIDRPRERAPLWREWIYRHFGGLDSDLYGDTDFDGRMAASRAGEVILTRLEANRHRVLRSPHLARTSESGYLKIVAPWQGSASVEQEGRSACARNGGWVIYDTTGSYAIANPERVDHLIVMLPKERMAERGLRLDGLMARHMGGACGISRVALETMRNTYQELPNMTEASAQGAGELIMQLVRLSLLEAADRPTAATQREALRDRIRALVAQRLRDPALSIDDIARSLNCSKRHLHNAFAGSGETLAGHIQDCRLRGCMGELRAAQHAGRTILDVALGWGFSNPAHFSRVFRAHTGVSPSEFRTSSSSRT